MLILGCSNQNPKGSEKRRPLLFLFLILLITSGVFTSCAKKDVAPVMPGESITLGTMQSETQADITSTGGDINVTNPNSLIDGMKINIPNGAYAESTNFSISTTEIKSHNLGSNFNPITPLITIDNGHTFSNAPMTVSIPIKINADEFAMAFYYDKASGTLEGIPIVDLTENLITIKTSHFSDLLISKILKGELEDLKIDTGFTPGYDDWQFVNNGSYIATNGHCAGQSISSMWYFYEKYKKAGERRLYGRYDNNDYGTGTVDFDRDDSWSYRYASVVQSQLAWDSNSKLILNELRGASDYLTFYAFAYSMLISQNPQYTGICYYLPDGTIGGGHALVVYKIEKNIIYVADPNYPGDATRTITYDTNTGKFLSYQSGANAEEIKKGNSTAYTYIGYFAVSSLINWDIIGAEYEKMIAGKSGDDLFPKFEVSVLKKVDSVTGVETFEKCAGTIIITEEETAKISPELKGKLQFKLDSQFIDQRLYLYNGTSLILGPEIRRYVTVDLNKGENAIGFYSDVQVNGEAEYIDFERVKVMYVDEVAGEPFLGIFEGQASTTYINEELFLNQGMLPGADESSKNINKNNLAGRKLMLDPLLNTDAMQAAKNAIKFQLTYFSDGPNRFKAGDVPDFACTIDGTVGLYSLGSAGSIVFPNPQNQVQLKTTKDSFEVVKAETVQVGADSINYVYTFTGKMEGDKLVGTWVTTYNGTEYMKGNFTATKTLQINDQGQTEPVS